MKKDIALMDLEGVMLNEISQIEKDRQHMWNLKNKINNKNKNYLIDTENILRATRWEGEGGQWKRSKGLRSTNGQIQNRDIKCSARKIVSNVVINM